MITPRTDAAVTNPRAELQRLFGYAAFRPGQEEVVTAVLAGEDVLAVMPTGAGKSLCYQLPAMLLPGCTVVISPLVALMKDQLESLPAALRARAAVFNSMVERSELEARTAELAEGRLKLVYVAPERLRQRPFLHALARARISRFVVDEAHCVSLWGHDFRPDYLFIPTVLEELGAPPVLAMTATATPAIQSELAERFGRPLRVVHTGVVRPNLSLDVEPVRNAEAKLTRLVEICRAERGAAIVYVSSRKLAEEVAGVLRRHGINARHYHAGIERVERDEAQDAFMSGRVRVMVATVAFGMGVDKGDVRLILHFNPSRSLEAYAQESGRAGRDGLPARCILFWATSDRTAMNRWAREDALTPDLLRAVYRAVRQGARGRFAWWPLDRLVRATKGILDPSGKTEVSETDVRVALGALEQVQVLRRHCDAPEVINLFPHPPPLKGRGSAEERRDDSDDTAGMERPPIHPSDLFEVAEDWRCTPAEAEKRLLAEQEAGRWQYSGYGRGLLVELLPHPDDLAQRLRAMLERQQRGQQDRLNDMIAYATGSVCRAARIAAHFGVQHAGRCGNCDVCRGRVTGNGERGTGSEDARGGTGTAPSLERAPEDIIIECVAELPFQMGRRGVARVLAGSVSSVLQADRSRHFGALSSLTMRGIERTIDALAEAGYLGREERPMPRGDGTYFVLSVTEAGFAKPPASWPPKEAVARRERAVGGDGRSAPRETRPRAAGAPRGRGAGRTSGGAAAALATFDEDDPAVGERFERLRVWRLRQSREDGLSPAYVFSNETLQLLATTHVASLDDLATIKGVGPAKLERYGQKLLELLATGNG